MDDEAKPFITPEELKLEDIAAVWRGVDLDTMGRVLRAHLVVEHFINEALVADGIDLQRLRDGGIRPLFHQKQKLLGERGAMALLADGINQLNAIRNRFGHNPAHKLTIESNVQVLRRGWPLPELFDGVLRRSVDRHAQGDRRC